MLLQSFNRGGGAALCCRSLARQLAVYTGGLLTAQTTTTISNSVALYSRRSDSKNLDSAFKVVKSKANVRTEDESFLGECGPNWEILSPRANRFYFPHSTGPAWQSADSTFDLEEPLEELVDFEGTASGEGAKLQFSVDECPSLIKKSLHELFPAPEVIGSEKLALVTLQYCGEDEQGAKKFVLAAQEITSRLRVRGYWADFMNPFSGKPFYSWANGKNLYKVDKRFRGINMRLIDMNSCKVILPEIRDGIFSGTIFTNAPSDYLELKKIIDEMFVP